MTLEGKLNFQLKKLNQNNWKNLKNIIGHRGVKDLAPENTLDSILNAFDLGLNWVEIDVKVSKDNIPFLLHDDTLNRTTNGKGLPINFEYDSLKNLDAGYFFYNQNTKIYIPTLQDILILSQKNNICLNIELKPNIGYEKENVKAIIKVIKKLDFNKEYYFSSFDLNSLIIMKEYFPDSKCGLLVETFNNNLSYLKYVQVSELYELDFHKTSLYHPQTVAYPLQQYLEDRLL